MGAFMSKRLLAKVLAPLTALLLLAAVALTVGGGDERKTLTAHFDQAISIYKGSDVVIMGVHVGRVTSVVPEGDSVRVSIEYDGKYSLPADVKAAVVTPTLVADRFVQLAPAYTSGPTLANGGDIPLTRTAVPVELDRIYASLDDLTTTLGPTGANKNGALDALLDASAKALGGNGQAGHDMIKNFSAAARTLDTNSDELFGTVDNLASFSNTLAANDKQVRSFLTRLSAVSSQLSGESDDLKAALVALANAVDTIRAFVHDNKTLVVKDVKELRHTLGILAQRKKTLGTVLQTAPLGLGNLATAFDPGTGTVGIRLAVGPALADVGNILCGVLKTNNAPNAAQSCELLKALMPNGGNYSSLLDPGATSSGTTSGTTSGPAGGLTGLLGGVQ